MIKTPGDGFCKNWKDNIIVPEKDLETEEFSSFFHSVRFETRKHLATDQTAENDDDSGVLDLGPFQSGSRLPTIYMRQLDVFGNDLDPSWSQNIEARLVVDHDYLEGEISEIAAHIVDDVVTFPSLTFRAPPDEYLLRVVYNIEGSEKTKLIKLTIEECGANEEMDEENICVKCNSAQYKSGGKCVPCPEGSACHGMFFLPTVGKWHKTPCQTRTRDCLIEDACKYTDREKKLGEFLDNLSSCEVETNDVDAYDRVQCDEV